MEDRIEFMEGVLALLVAERYGVELNELEENIIDDFFNNQYYRPWLPKEEEDWMVLKKRLDNYFMGKQGKVLKLSNGYSVKLTVVNHHYNSLDLRFYYDEETTDINFNYYDSFIIASSDCDSKQVKVIDMHHVGYIIDTTLCDWVENRDDIGLEWSNYMEKENDYED